MCRAKVVGDEHHLAVTGQTPETCETDVRTCLSQDHPLLYDNLWGKTRQHRR